MTVKENYMGKITVSDTYIMSLVRRTVSGCFGVAGMRSGSFFEYILSDIFKCRRDDIGIRIRSAGGELIVDIHITVTFGTNISEVARSIRGKVKFAVMEATGITVAAVNVYADNIRD